MMKSRYGNLLRYTFSCISNFFAALFIMEYFRDHYMLNIWTESLVIFVYTVNVFLIMKPVPINERRRFT